MGLNFKASPVPQVDNLHLKSAQNSTLGAKPFLVRTFQITPYYSAFLLALLSMKPSCIHLMPRFSKRRSVTALMRSFSCSRKPMNFWNSLLKSEVSWKWEWGRSHYRSSANGARSEQPVKEDFRMLNDVFKDNKGVSPYQITIFLPPREGRGKLISLSEWFFLL